MERYGEPHLSDVRICVRVPHREAIPVRCDTRIFRYTNIIPEPEQHSEAGLCGGITKPTGADGADSYAAGLGAKAASCDGGAHADRDGLYLPLRPRL